MRLKIFGEEADLGWITIWFINCLMLFLLLITIITESLGYQTW